jgi:hypothetical protein
VPEGFLDPPRWRAGMSLIDRRVTRLEAKQRGAKTFGVIYLWDDQEPPTDDDDRSPRLRAIWMRHGRPFPSAPGNSPAQPNIVTASGLMLT